MRVLVCGDRHWKDKEAIETVLRHLPKGTTIVHGAQRGADKMADAVAKELRFERDPHPADWDRFGERAGPIRNRSMLSPRPDLVIAFHTDIDSSGGTRNMVRQAQALGVYVQVYSHPMQWRALDMPMRRCPACSNGKEVRFKLGVRVWKGKRLRVCGGKCKRRVRKEVRELIREHPDIDPERLRRRVAWRYLKKEG